MCVCVSCLCFKTLQGRIVRREGEARLDVQEGSREEIQKDNGGKRSTMKEGTGQEITSEKIKYYI